MMKLDKELEPDSVHSNTDLVILAVGSISSHPSQSSISSDSLNPS